MDQYTPWPSRRRAQFTGFYSLDGTGLFVGGSTYLEGNNTCSFHCGGFIDRHGVWYTPNFPASLVAREDPNGNKISYTDTSKTAYVDTMNRTVPLPPAPSTSADFTGCVGPLATHSAALWYLPAQGTNNTVLYKLCYAQFTLKVSSNNGCTGVLIPNPPTVTRLQSVILPNGTAWIFEYSDRDPLDDADVNYGSLTKVTFPQEEPSVISMLQKAAQLPPVDGL